MPYDAWLFCENSGEKSLLCTQLPKMSIFSPASRSCLTCLTFYKLTKHSPNKNEIPPPHLELPTLQDDRHCTHHLLRNVQLQLTTSSLRLLEEQWLATHATWAEESNRDTVALAFKVLELRCGAVHGACPCARTKSSQCGGSLGQRAMHFTNITGALIESLFRCSKGTAGPRLQQNISF